MTGAEHYAEAERLLVGLRSVKSTIYAEAQAVIIAEAQAHATLAMAAAQVETAFATTSPSSGIRNDWIEAIS
jgi:hypothetical protein